ncbi:hypothetical protein PAXRUDRAFT_829194 [Paxillus rubicundulus Ve08.2h10]|uniref:Uncharacterized protein n=1 Tax=Paxillus rubicundulus Ve08.2h10 TaxID=930991 RepID=A0A0D0E679_9AGAM|nr:hypothetical protein PAXRUDRAFT_829194 [Paxillus rubicundulus Ve08.2h10]
MGRIPLFDYPQCIYIIPELIPVHEQGLAISQLRRKVAKSIFFLQWVNRVLLRPKLALLLQLSAGIYMYVDDDKFPTFVSLQQLRNDFILVCRYLVSSTDRVDDIISLGGFEA